MNQSTRSIRQSLSQSQTSKKSFRVLVKNRITHEIVDQQNTQKPLAQLELMRSTIENESFQQAKSNLKKYIRNMKASSKISNYESRVNTNRSSCPNINKLKTLQGSVRSSRALLAAKKHQDKSRNEDKLLGRTFHHLNKNQSSHMVGNEENYEKCRDYLNADMSSLQNDQNVHSNTLQHQNLMSASSIEKLPNMKSSLQQYSNFEDSHCQDYTKRNSQSYVSQRLSELENRIQGLLVEKMKILSSNESVSISHKNRNMAAFRLLEKEMDRVLEQIRKVKELEEVSHSMPIDRNVSISKSQTFLNNVGQTDSQINKNIEMLEKKVKIIERLIAEKLFESDNLKNQYLWKIKQHKKNHSELPNYSRNSKSSTFYRDVNLLNPSNFKPNRYQKESLLSNEKTTNQADYKTPLKSYYITPKRDHFYNSQKLTQPLPRSTYNRQYLVYGNIPRDFVNIKAKQKDHAIFASNNLSHNKEKLEGSTYKDDFITKKEKNPVNFRQLDAYRNKFRNLEVNYGKQKNSEKVVNSQSVVEFYHDHQDDNHNRNSGLNQQQNPQKTDDFPSIPLSSAKASHLRTKLQQLSRPLIENITMTQKRASMIQQQEIKKMHLFNQRIKSEIKHKNLYDQKYKFKTDLMQRIKIHDNGISSIKKQRITRFQTVAY